MRELYEQLRNLTEVVQYLSNKTGHSITIYGMPGNIRDNAHFSIEGDTATTCIYPYQTDGRLRAFNTDPFTDFAQQDLLTQILRINSIDMEQ
jgi:hypothetical protein